MKLTFAPFDDWTTEQCGQNNKAMMMTTCDDYGEKREWLRQAKLVEYNVGEHRLENSMELASHRNLGNYRKWLRSWFYQEVHNGVSDGHLGVNRTIMKSRERYYWARSCRSIISMWPVFSLSSMCCVCVKGLQTRSSGPMKQYNTDASFQRIGVDVPNLSYYLSLCHLQSRSVNSHKSHFIL